VERGFARDRTVAAADDLSGHRGRHQRVAPGPQAPNLGDGLSGTARGRQASRQSVEARYTRCARSGRSRPVNPIVRETSPSAPGAGGTQARRRTVHRTLSASAASADDRSRDWSGKPHSCSVFETSYRLPGVQELPIAAGSSMPPGRSVKTRALVGRLSGFEGCVISWMILSAESIIPTAQPVCTENRFGVDAASRRRKLAS
jgi:hypothetical protein